MFQQVDCIGIESVCKLIEQTKLPKFVIFKQGVGKGAIPVFEFVVGDNTAKAVNAFRNWANSLLSANPYNGINYEILLFDKRTDFDGDDDDEIKPEVRTELGKRGRRKENKIRFSFCLTQMAPYGGGFQQGQGFSGPVDVSKAIQEGIAQALQAKELHELRERVKQLENDDDDEDEEEEKSSALDKVFKVVNALNQREKLKRGGAMAGDDDDEDFLDDDDEEENLDEDEEEDLDEDEEEETVRKKPKQKPSPSSKQPGKKLSPEGVQKLRKALAVLSKHSKNLPNDMTRLAKFANSNPALFKQYMENLKNIVP